MKSKLCTKTNEINILKDNFIYFRLDKQRNKTDLDFGAMTFFFFHVRTHFIF